MTDQTPRPGILVWDLPLRIFHWLLAASFAGAFLTAESERWRDVHVMLGYTMLALVVVPRRCGASSARATRGSRASHIGPSRVLVVPAVAR